MTDVEPALTLHKLEDEAGVLAGVAGDVVLKLPDSAVDVLGAPGALGLHLVVEGHVVNGDVERQADAAFRRVADLRHRGGTPHEAVGEGNNARRGRMLLVA